MLKKENLNDADTFYADTLNAVDNFFEGSFPGKCVYRCGNESKEVKSLNDAVVFQDSIIPNTGLSNISDMRGFEVPEMDVSYFAFPHTRDAGFEQNGMTKREVYAKEAINIFSNSHFIEKELPEILNLKGEIGIELRKKVLDVIARTCFEMADAMLKYSDVD